MSAIGPPLAETPTGTFHYRMIDGALDWYLTANHLRSGRAYRVALADSTGEEYAVASERSAVDGSFVAHGIETGLWSKECVGVEDPSHRALNSTPTLWVLLRNDGSTAGGVDDDLVGSRGELPCHGNGDDDWEYVMSSTARVPVRQLPVEGISRHRN